MLSLLQQLQEFTKEVFNDPELVPDEAVRVSGSRVMSEVKSKGHAFRQNLTDKEARSVFVTIQASAERKAVEEVAKTTGANYSSSAQAAEPDEMVRVAYVALQAAAEQKMVDSHHAANTSDQLAKSVWIIHTPTIATPCVTEGAPTSHLLAEEIMNDEARKSLTLSRASIIRDYLSAGGILIVAYDKNQRQERRDEATQTVISKGRTAEQIAIFEKLKSEYPQQIIDFPIDIETNYPLDMIGATYLTEDTTNNTFEMTNLGIQANDPRNEATWGVWMQNRAEPVPEVSQRIAQVFSFLQDAGLNQALEAHSQRFKISPDDYIPLLSPHMNSEVDIKRMGHKMQ